MSETGHDAEQVRKLTMRTPESAAEPAPAADVNPLSTLQRMIGNRAVQRLMTPTGQVVQTKMSVTASNDAFEAEADAVAEQVIRKMDAPQVAQREGDDEEISLKRIQRDAEDEEISMKRIQRSETDMMGAFDVGDDFEASLSSARGGGSPIAEGARGKMEAAMGADFSNVRIHEGAQADSLNQSIQAKAFTTGSDIFFKSGEYNPGSTDGQRLLAHELTHTIQQGAVNTKREDSKE